MKLHRLLTLAAAPAVCVAVSTATANIISNPGFELGTGDDADSWTQLEITAGLGGVAATDRSNAAAGSGGFSMSLGVTGVVNDGPNAEIQQIPAAGSVVPGTEYDFSFLAQGVAGPGSVGFYEVSWFDADGSDGGGPQGSATGLQTYPLNPAFTPVAVTGLVAPPTADSVLVQIRLVTGAFDGASGSAFIDDVVFAAAAPVIPEPTSVVLAGLAAVAVGARGSRER